MQRLLPLLLAAACGHAQAALDAAACKPRYVALPSGAVPAAASRLAEARSAPGGQQLALADALADLALLSARKSGSPDIATDGNPAPAELLRQALAIWNAAPPSAALASSLRTRGVELFDSQQCRLGREVLESALRASDTAAGPNAPASMAIAQDLLRIGLAQGDDVLVRRLAPAAKAALDGRTQPLDPRDEQTVLALVDFYYRQPDAAGQQDLRLAEQLAQRALALTTPGTASSARRPLSYRLVSIYYAQGRYAEGEALRTQLAAGAAPTTPSYPFARQREELIALVRKGELPAALVMARTLVEQRQQAYDAGLQALLQAETAQAQLQRNRATAASAQEQTEVLRSIALAGHAVGQAHTRQNIETFWLAQARSYLGEIQHALGDLDGAAQAYEAALAGFGDGRPGNWQDRTRTRGGLAIVARMRKDYARARALQQQVLDELLPLVGEDHPDVQEARAELALLAKLQHG